MTSAQSSLLPVRSEISPIDGVCNFGERRGTARSIDAHHTCKRVGSVQRTVGSAQHFDVIGSRNCEHPKVNRSTDVAGGNVINEDLIGIAVTAAHEQIAQTAAPSGLRQLCAR